jgi:hypothetical protein
LDGVPIQAAASLSGIGDVDSGPVLVLKVFDDRVFDAPPRAEVVYLTAVLVEGTPEDKREVFS